MRRALLFAGHSFLGRWLARELPRRGWSLTSTSRVPASDHEIACDLMDSQRVAEIVERARPTCIFQCAGATSGNDPRVPFDLHVTGTFHVLDAVRRYSPDSHVVLLGSAAEYGPVVDASFPIHEGCPARPGSLFGASKAAQTRLAEGAAAEWGLRITIARPFNIIGPGLPEHYFAAALASRLRRERAAGNAGAVPIVNSQATRDFVDVRDVANALLAISDHDVPHQGEVEIYNVASGVETSLLTMAGELGRLAGGFELVDGGATASRAGIVRSCGDATRLRIRTGWKPVRTWQESLRDMWRSSATMDKLAPPPGLHNELNPPRRSHVADRVA